MNKFILSRTGLLAASILAAACTTSKPHPDTAAATTTLTNAAQDVNRAASDQRVAQYAQPELQRAQTSLKRAEKTWHEKQDIAATSHLAYLARQQAATAMERANARAAEESVKVASAERDQMVAGLPKGDQQLQQDLAGLPAQVTARGLVVTVPQERFAVNQAKLPADAAPAIEQLAAVLKKHPERKVAIEGHTDSEGGKAYNKDLGRERAEAVRAALISHGVPANRIIMRSYGEAYPVASNDSSAGRKENRRADVVISDAHGRVMEPSASSSGATSTGASSSGTGASGK